MNLLTPNIHVRPLFTGTLLTRERVGQCHRCGRDITIETGITPRGLVNTYICTECATSDYNLFSVSPQTDGCVCGRPVPCTCAISCTLCGGLLPLSGGP